MATTESETDTRHPGQVPTKFQISQPFFKSPSCLTRHEARIVLPKDARNVHYEAEMVIVIGKRASNVSAVEAADYVLGITIGNDVSAREWQDGDVQWWRAKRSDTFGPFMVSGLDYDHLQLQLRVNGEVKQNESTASSRTPGSPWKASVSCILTKACQACGPWASDAILTPTPPR